MYQQEIEVTIPPESNLVSQWITGFTYKNVDERSLTEVGMILPPKNIAKTLQPGMDDDFPKDI